jgi:predicted ATPase
VIEPITNAVQSRADNGHVHAYEHSVESLYSKELLLVLDHLDTVLEPAAKYVADLLTQAPDVVVLATAERPLGLRNEQVLHVPRLLVQAPHESALPVSSSQGS